VSVVADTKNAKSALLNKKAYNELVLSCSDEISFGIVESAKTNEIKHGDAKLAWDNLTQRYEPDTGAELIKLKREYNSLTMSRSDDPDDYISKLDLYRSKMKKVPFNHDISDEDFFIHILNTLPIEYDSVVEAMERKLTKKKLTTNKLKVELRTKYSRLKRTQTVTDDIGLFANGFKKKFKGTCRICGKQGHKAADCWENPNNSNNRLNKNNDKKNQSKSGIKCFYCGKLGHIKSECRKYLADTAAKKSSEDTANVAENEEDEDMVFLAKEFDHMNTDEKTHDDEYESDNKNMSRASEEYPQDQ